MATAEEKGKQPKSFNHKSRGDTHQGNKEVNTRRNILPFLLDNNIFGCYVKDNFFRRPFFFLFTNVAGRQLTLSTCMFKKDQF